MLSCRGKRLTKYIYRTALLYLMWCIYLAFTLSNKLKSGKKTIQRERKVFTNKYKPQAWAKKLLTGVHFKGRFSQITEKHIFSLPSSGICQCWYFWLYSRGCYFFLTFLPPCNEGGWNFICELRKIFPWCPPLLCFHTNCISAPLCRLRVLICSNRTISYDMLSFKNRDNGEHFRSLLEGIHNTALSCSHEK